MGEGIGLERGEGRVRGWVWGMNMQSRTEIWGLSVKDNVVTINHWDGS